MDPILTDVKRSLGIVPEVKAFDSDIKTYINSTLATLYELGVDNTDEATIDTGRETWDEIFGDNPVLRYIKTYIYMQVKLLFDPPANGYATDALKNTINEFEWRITNYPKE